MLEAPACDSFVDSILSISIHRPGFPCSCLTVCKDRTVVALHDRHDDLTGALLIDLLLRGILPVGVVKSVLFGSPCFSRLFHEYLAGLLVHVNYFGVPFIQFFLTDRSAPDGNLYRLRRFTHLNLLQYFGEVALLNKSWGLGFGVWGLGFGLTN